MKKLILFFSLMMAVPAFAASPPAVKVEVGSGHGSGVYLGHGYVLTAGHVADAATDFEVTIKTQSDGYTYTGKVMWKDTRRDFALLKISDQADIMPAKLACRSPVVGEKITVVGWPDGTPSAIRVGGYIGSIEGKNGPWIDSYITIAPIFFGNSGGPAYDEKGELLGLMVGGLREQMTLSILIPLKEVCPILPRGL